MVPEQQPDQRGEERGQSYTSGHWHPRWCHIHWCTAWGDDQPAYHRSDPACFTGADNVSYYLFLEADQYGLEPQVRLVAEAPPYRGHWWDPDESQANITLTLRETPRVAEALTDLLAEVRSDRAGVAVRHRANGFPARPDPEQIQEPAGTVVAAPAKSCTGSPATPSPPNVMRERQL